MAQQLVSDTRVLQLPLAAGLKIAAVAAGMQHSLALSEDGRVFAWGAGHYGALGLGSSA